MTEDMILVVLLVSTNGPTLEAGRAVFIIMHPHRGLVHVADLKLARSVLSLTLLWLRQGDLLVHAWLVLLWLLGSFWSQQLLFLQVVLFMLSQEPFCFKPEEIQ